MRLSYILCHSFKSFHAKPSEFCIHLSPEAQSISEVFGVFTSERCQGTCFDHKDVFAVNSGSVH